jgi:type I restriction enzyme S subunit
MTEADPARVRGLWIQPGDLLIERSNARELVGTASLYSGPADLAVYPDLVIRARVGDVMLPEYAELVLKSPASRQYFQSAAQGISGSMPKIDQRAIMNLRFPLPSRDDQVKTVREVDRQLSLIDALQDSVSLA